jgi:hypothetical protein
MPDATGRGDLKLRSQISGPYQAKLTLMSESLRNDGRVWVPKKKGDTRSPDQIVFNLPHRGNRFLFSEKGLKDNRQLYAFLEERHFGIEYRASPKGLATRRTADTPQGAP